MSEDRKNHIEVEIRALVKNLDLIKSKIENLGGEYLGFSSLHDIYFCNNNITTVEKAEMHEVGSYSLRLRKYSKDDKTSINLNTKTITKKGDHNAWEEHETDVLDFNEAAKILLTTEFKPFFELQKTRYEYKLKELNVFLDDIKDFGACIEVEIITHPGDETNAKDKIINFLAGLGITKDDVVPKSVTNLVMKERAFKSEIDFD